jgi:hypothetical protein
MQITSYKVNNKHRMGKPTEKASMWTVSEWVEIQIFGEAGVKEWKSPKRAVLWSLLPSDNRLKQIGKDVSHNLFFAKFICDGNNEWHGYPVHPRGSDIPPETVLELWRQSSLIDKATKKKIQGGQYQ